MENIEMGLEVHLKTFHWCNSDHLIIDQSFVEKVGWSLINVYMKTRQSNQCGFCIYIFDQSKSMVRLVRAEKMVLSGLVFARKIARMILIQNIQGLMGPLMINMAFMPLYMWEMWDVMPVTDGHMDELSVESSAVFCLSWLRNKVERNPLL